jgi:uncharacterized protein (DUF952 family)
MVTHVSVLSHICSHAGWADARDPVSILFPHLFGPMPTSAVIAVTEYLPGEDGRFAPIQFSDT